LTVKFLNVNVPEFIPISERKETDLDKGSKFVTMFTQIEQMLGINIKDEFILNKLFPNDIMSDIIDVDAEEEELTEEEILDNDEDQSEEDILGLFESGLSSLVRNKQVVPKKKSQLWVKKKDDKFRFYAWKFNMNVDW
jgi:hypothetical protein